MSSDKCIECCNIAKLGEKTHEHHKFCSVKCQKSHHEKCTLMKEEKTIVVHLWEDSRFFTTLSRNAIEYLRLTFPDITWTTDSTQGGKHIYLTTLSLIGIKQDIEFTSKYKLYEKIPKDHKPFVVGLNQLKYDIPKTDVYNIVQIVYRIDHTISTQDTNLTALKEGIDRLIL